ncbi:MAG: hypothetical protein ACD_23C00179G0003 [uncultured bacterium]|nr:MAG: hypothetical protein ACD_23C00179G0003 [uncultured bacterium]
MVQLKLGQGLPPIVGAVVHIDHIEMGLQQGNGRQKSVAIQAMKVQIIRFEIGSSDKTHTLLKQGLEQSVQNHGIGDV